MRRASSASSACAIWLPIVAEKALALRHAAVERDAAEQGAVEREPTVVEVGGTLSSKADPAVIALCLSLMALWVVLCAGAAYVVWHWGEDEVQWDDDFPDRYRGNSDMSEASEVKTTLTSDTERARNIEKAVLDRDVADEFAESMVARKSLNEEQQVRDRCRWNVLVVVLVVCVLGLLYLGLSMCFSSPYAQYGADCQDNVMVVVDAAENQPRHVFQGSEFPVLIGKTTSQGDTDCAWTYKLVCAVPAARRQTGSFFNGPFVLFEAMFGKSQNQAALETRHTCTEGHIDERKVVRIANTMTVGLPAALTLHTEQAFNGAKVKAKDEDRGMTLTQVDKHVLAMQAELADVRQRLAQCEAKECGPPDAPLGNVNAAPGKSETTSTTTTTTRRGLPVQPPRPPDGKGEAASNFADKPGGGSRGGGSYTAETDLDARTQGPTRGSESTRVVDAEPDGRVNEVFCFQEDLELLHAHLREEGEEEESPDPADLPPAGDARVALLALLRDGGSTVSSTGSSTGSYPEAAQVTVSCDPGFTVDGLPDGATTMQSTCVKGGWSVTSLECEPVMCNPLPLKHSENLRISWLTDRSDEVPRWAHGAIETVDCHTGYTSDAQPPAEGNTRIEVSCVNGVAHYRTKPAGTDHAETGAEPGHAPDSWSEDAFDCQPVVCPAPAMPHASVPVTTYGAGEAEASCHKGYTLSDDPSDHSFVVSCGADGQVLGLEGRACAPVDCGDPVPHFGGPKVAEYEGVTTFVPQQRSGKIWCREGWTLNGKEDGVRSRSLTCSPSGVWDTIGSGVCLNTQCGGETSKVVSCPVGLSFDGKPCVENPTDEQPSNCRMTTTCDKEHGWTPEPQQCMPIVCSGFRANNAMVPRATYGRAAVRGWCDDGHEVEGLPGKTSFFVRCDANGKHMNALKCKPVDCGDPLPAFGGHEVATFIGDTRLSTAHSIQSKIQCKDGFTFTGKEGGEKEVAISCMEGGVWSEFEKHLQCRHTECDGELTKVVKCPQGFSFDGKPCDPSASNCYATLTCGTSGWSPKRPECRPIDCGQPSLAPWWKEHHDFYSALFRIEEDDRTDNTYTGKGRALFCRWFPNPDNCLSGQIDERRGMVNSNIKQKNKKYIVPLRCGADGQWAEPAQWETEQCAYPIRAKDMRSTSSFFERTLFGMHEEASHVLTSTGANSRIESQSMERYNLNQRWIVESEGKIRSAASDDLCLSAFDPAKGGQTHNSYGYLNTVDCYSGRDGDDTWKFSQDTVEKIESGGTSCLSPCCSLMPTSGGWGARGGFPGSYYMTMPPASVRKTPNAETRYLWGHDGSIQELHGRKARAGPHVGYRVDKHGRILKPYAHEKDVLDEASEAFDMLADPWPKIVHWKWLADSDFPLTALSFWWRGHSQDKGTFAPPL